MSTLSSPMGVTVDRTTGRLFVADWVNGRVQSWPNAASFGEGTAADKSTEWDGTGGLTLNPVAVVTDANSNLYIADLGNSRVLGYSPPNYTSYFAVLGQQNFSGSEENQGGLTPTERTLAAPLSLAVDSSNHLFVADRNNNRVLRYTLPITTNQMADIVLGQEFFVLKGVNRGNGAGSPGNDGLNQPRGVAVDSAGNLYVSDTYNNRVLKFDLPLTSGKAASLVLGQANFTSNLINRTGDTGLPTADSLYWPSRLAVDRHSRLYVADIQNTRVLGFDVRHPSNGDAAKIVIGQPDFGPPQWVVPTAYSLAYPNGVAVGNDGSIYVADTSNNRVLGYDAPWPWYNQLPVIMK